MFSDVYEYMIHALINSDVYKIWYSTNV